MVSIYLMAIANEKFYGIKVVKFNQIDLTEDGYFLFVDSNRWALAENEIIENANNQTSKLRRTLKNKLVHEYKLIDLLKFKGFNYIFEKTKFYKNRICWDIVANENDN